MSYTAPTHEEPTIVPPARLHALTGLVSSALFVGIIFISGLLVTTGVPRPDDPPADAQAYFTDNAAIIEAGALVRTTASVLLVAFCALMAGVIRQVNARAVGAASTVVAGGALTALAGTLSVLCGMALTTLEQSSALPTIEALRQLNFLTGGAGYTVWLGLVLGPMCLILRRARALPSWLSMAGLVSAAFAFLSVLALAIAPAMLFIPLGRFSALLVLAAISVLLAANGVHPGRYRASVLLSVLGGLSIVVVAMAVTIVI